LNAAWHRAHPMPAGASKEERTEWHASHEEACGCRPVPAELEDEVASLRRVRERDD
jgi:hypothetical protein